MEQTIITAAENYRALDEWLAAKNVKNALLVRDSSYPFLTGIREKLLAVEARGIRLIPFSDFQPNPLYESVVEGVRVFREHACDAVLAIGGGSAIDVAKCIKLYSNLPGDGADGSYLTAPIVENRIPFLAMPTTAGTGSEATRFAVVYYEGAKQSIAHISCIPDCALMDPGALKTLPLYQKKATMADALCHAIESFWSVNSTEESKGYSIRAITGVLEHLDGYLLNDDQANAGMLEAAHFAGKAINITQTTAGHAMCYKITSLFRAAHGHAALLCDRVLYPWMIDHTDLCIDPRGKAYLDGCLNELGKALGGTDARTGADQLRKIFERLKLEIPEATPAQYEELKRGVNPVRLKNFPVALESDVIDALYHQILR